MPKKSRRAYVSRSLQERRRLHTLKIAAGAVSLILVVLLGAGLWFRSADRRTPVARVDLPDGETAIVLRGDFHDRVRFERERYRDLAYRENAAYAYDLNDVYGFGQMVLQRMIREALIRQAALERRLALSDAEVDVYVDEVYLELSRSAPPSGDDEAPKEPPSPEKLYRNDLADWRALGFSRGDFREVVRLLLLEERVRAEMGDEAFESWLESWAEKATWLDGWEAEIPDVPRL